ncbi:MULTISPECIES: penicillin acylase family protein [unclassified Nocardioides]|uniref:penicillin acylase family protein n=1 Tax=Nocardioides sp. URHA0032 TaxID=1380388 RepID=UPI000568091C|nr:penicillin acylase family protein [Nocardioides sp. URHA0032]
MATVVRDAYGIPQVRAGDVLDLARGQGEATARDRPTQLARLRQATEEPLARRTGTVDLARRVHARLRPETAAFVGAYVEGVNAVLDEPWDPWTPLAVFRVHHLLFGNLAGKLWSARARAVLGEDARLLSREGPLSSGSNAWAVGGARTATGLPLIGGDPHRALESPSIYLQVRLTCDEFDVAGLAFAGVPGVQHFAHAGDVAWAITNGMGNYEDVYAERLRRTGRGTEALGSGGWEPVEEGEGWLRTRRGPVFAGPAEGRGLSLRTPSGDLEDLGFDTFLPLLRSRSAADVMAALDGWVEPVNNVVAADRGGDVLFRVAGRVPVRPEANRVGVVDAADPAAAWDGWVALPVTSVPPDGQVVTANDRRGPESAAIGTDFASPHRRDRIHALLDGRTGLTTDDFAAIHRDTLLLSVPLFQALLRELPAGAVRDEILAWDGHMDADSSGAAAFAAWRSALTRRIAAEPVLAPLAEPLVDDPELTPWLTVTAHVALALEALVEARTPFGIDLAALATAALDDAAGHPATWGETHVVAPVGEPVPPLPLSGDIECVRCTSSQPGVTDACARGSVARYVWDLAGGGGWVVPLGAADHGPHRVDQLPVWAAGELLTVFSNHASA